MRRTKIRCHETDCKHNKGMVCISDEIEISVREVEQGWEAYEHFPACDSYEEVEE